MIFNLVWELHIQQELLQKDLYIVEAGIKVLFQVSGSR